MTERVERFIAEYLREPNATKAAKLAGYSEKTAYSQGQRLLKNVEVKRRIDATHEKATRRAEITVARVVEGIASIATNPDARDADRLKAWELLGRHLAMFTDRVQIDHTYLQSYIRGKLEEVGVDVEAEDAVNEAMRLLGAK